MDINGEQFSSYLELLEFIQRLPRDVSICGLVFGVVIVVLVFLGNTFIIWAVQRDKRLRTRANVFLVSMALAEILTMLARDIPILMMYARGSWQFGPSLLVANFLIDRQRNVLAVVHVLLITLYRYVMIVFNKYHHYIAKTFVIVLLLVAMYGIPMFVFLYSNQELFQPDIDLKKYLIFNTKTLRMMTMNDVFNFEIADRGNTTNVRTVPNHTRLTITREMTAFLFFLVAALVLAVFYIHIYVYLRNHAKQLNRWANPTHSSQPGHQQPKPKPTQHDVKFVKTMAIVFVAYVFSYFWLPILAIADVRGTIPHAVFLPFVLLNWSNSCMNWAIYALSNARFRQNLVQIFRCRMRDNKVTVVSSISGQDNSASPNNTGSTTC